MRVYPIPTYCFIVALIFGLKFDSIAQDNIPSTKGFGGYIFLLPGYFAVESNLLVAGPPLVGDVGNHSINSIFEAPQSQNSFAFGFAGELNYTFSKSRTQLFFGNRLEDILRLDVPFGFGIRQELPDKSILAMSFLLTPLELLFWSDPFVENVERKETYLFYPGVRFRWGRILKTGLEFTATFRQYDFREEKSGDWLVSQARLDPAHQHHIDRNGKVLKLMGLYRIDVKKHRFEPAVRYVLDDRNGKAISQSGFSLQLTYIYRTPKALLDVNLLLGSRSADEIHPVYGESLNTKRIGAAITTIIPIKLFNSKKWGILLTAEILQEIASISFYNTRVASAFVGIMWRNQKT